MYCIQESSNNNIDRLGLGICSLLFCSKSLRLLSECERFALVALKKSATVSDSLGVAHDKRGTMSELLLVSLKKAVVIRLWFEQICSWADGFQKVWVICLKNVFLYVFDIFLQFFPCFFAQERGARAALCSVTLFFRARGEIRSSCSSQKREWLRSIFKKSNCERFTPVDHNKRATGAIHPFLQANRYFAILLTKNQRFPQKTKIDKQATLFLCLSWPNFPLSGMWGDFVDWKNVFSQLIIFSF